MNVLPVFSLFAFILMLVLLPLLFGELMASLGKLHLSPEAALLLLKRIAHERVVPMHPLAVIGLGGLWPGMVRERRETIIAVNFGGCVVPTGLAVYQLPYLSAAGVPALLALLVTAGINIMVCYFVARPVQGVGILLPGLAPAAVAALLALIFAPGDAAPVAYVAGVAGPLIGADLLHLREIEQSAVWRGQHWRGRNVRWYRPFGNCGCLFGVIFAGPESKSGHPCHPAFRRPSTRCA